MIPITITMQLMVIILLLGIAVGALLYLVHLVAKLVANP